MSTEGKTSDEKAFDLAPRVTGFPDYEGFPSWLTWKAADGCEVTYGDDGDQIITRMSGEKLITVSAPSPSGARWFETTDPRGLAAALIAAADHIDAQRQFSSAAESLEASK